MGEEASEMGADWERTGSGLGAAIVGTLCINKIAIVKIH